MIGIVSSHGVMCDEYRISIIANSGISPKAKLTMPEITDATGRTSVGNLTCLMIRSRVETDVIASPMLLLNHFHGRIAAKMKSGYASILRWKMTETSTT